MKPSSIPSAVIAGTMKWGAWGAQFSTTEYEAMIMNCVECGVYTFDHADIYGHYTTEEEFGKAIAGHSALRKNISLITKCGIRMVTPNRPDHKIKSYDTSSQHILQSAERSLKNLHTDYIDILLIHRPDPLMDPDEIAEAFTKLQQQGKVLAFGVSNFSVSQTELIASRFPITSNQLEISIVRMEPLTDGTLDQCMIKGLIPMSWSPLGGGKIHAGESDERSRKIIAVAEILAEKYNASSDQILLAWLHKHPSGIIPVLGTTKIERIKKALAAEKIELTRDEWFLLWRASAGQEVA